MDLCSSSLAPSSQYEGLDRVPRDPTAAAGYTRSQRQESVVVEIFREIMPLQNEIRRVPLLMRDKQARPGAYKPAVVSLGPYHHRNPELHYAEPFKKKCLKVFVAENGGSMEKSDYKKKILERIDEIRGWYPDVDSDYTDLEFADMILRDACFLIYYLACKRHSTHGRDGEKSNIMTSYFGISKRSFILSDLYVLDNQIPLWVPRFLFQLKTGDESGFKNLLYSCLHRKAEHPGPCLIENSPHFLDFCHKYCVPRKHLVSIHPEYTQHRPQFPSVKNRTYRFQSITNLIAKGIRLRMSKPKNEAAISFTPYSSHGVLSLPKLTINSNSFAYFSNLIAYEMSPISSNMFTYMSSYITLMKSLIENSNDVKILREKGMLSNHLVSDDEVVMLFKDLQTFGRGNSDYLADVRYEMDKHCCRKANTWIADLLETYFKTPWRALALLGALALLTLTFLQTYYTIRQSRAG